MTRFETLPADWLGVEEALQRVLARARPLPGERVPVLNALGRALAEDVVAPATLPPWDNSAMDGYALRAADVEGADPGSPVRLRVVSQIRAGDLPEREIAGGEAARIMTGAPVPPGADAVVRVEDTDAEAGRPGTVEIRAACAPGRNVRPGGEDVREGEIVLRRGTSVGPGQVAVLAAVGRTEVTVHGRPLVAVLSSGDELRGPEAYAEVVAGRGVPESNGPALAAAVRAAGGEALALGVARDDENSIRERVARAGDADLLVTTGGASMGEADLFKRVLDGLGLELEFWRVRLRPGSPLSFGSLPRGTGREGRLPVFGLPGNPSSAFVTFQLFVRPYLLALAGHVRRHRRVVRAVAAERLASTGRLTHLLRVTLEERPGGGPAARPAGPQGSGLVRTLGVADGLAVLPEGVDVIPPGEPVEVILLDDAPGALAAPGYRAAVT